ncbi:zinc finger CCCH domain-containing protein 32 isoform X1 [Musa acuminata AAA Group]|uniref:zinc finger CCCH domain-containing protein 32 isoform X1 n=1 Tax=Musa acuminata AAA Group TaxID=214697 RepID=UPI0031D4B795
MESDGGRESIRPATAEEEAVKGSTDCVYFLASPLTCKKFSIIQGSECEYRHSEGARINPRDCWYWLNGNCLNPKCSFRHPPLDSWFAKPMPTSGPLQPPPTAVSTQIPDARAPPNNASKKSAPCYYFQRGQCLKGERCPYTHGTYAVSSYASQKVAKASTCLVEPPQIIKEDTQQNITMQQNVTEFSVDKRKMAIEMPVEMPPKAKLVTKAEKPDGDSSENKLFLPYSLDDGLPKLPQNYVAISSGYSLSKPWSHQMEPSDGQTENNKDTDEFLREYSPGFDVLVEDDIKDPDYFHNEDNFRMASNHGGQNLEAEDDYDYHHYNYQSMTNFERDQCNGIEKYDSYKQTGGTYSWDPKVSDRILDKPSSLKRRVLDKETKLDQMDDLDLRHRLLKQRCHGSRSMDSRDDHGEHYCRDDHCAERGYGHHSRDQRQFPLENSIGTRLQGRITFPGRLEKERSRRPRGRQSPTERMNHQRTHPERIRQQFSEDFSKGTSIRNKPTRRDDMNSLDFASPKSLAELKGAKINGNSNEQSIRSSSPNTKMNRMLSEKVEVLQESENSLSFEGPKPLSVILKRKRESAYTNSGISLSQYENNQGGGESATRDYVPAAVTILQSVPSSEAGKEATFMNGNHEVDKLRAVDEEGLILKDDGKTNDAPSSTIADAVEIGDGMDLENVEDEELENSYEAGKFKAEDAEKTCQVDDDELDDEDDFARKVSVMLS